MKSRIFWELYLLPIHVGFLIELLSDTEDEGYMFLRHVG
jgi:hypothetical protein